MGEWLFKDEELWKYGDLPGAAAHNRQPRGVAERGGPSPRAGRQTDGHGEVPFKLGNWESEILATPPAERSWMSVTSPPLAVLPCGVEGCTRGACPVGCCSLAATGTRQGHLAPSDALQFTLHAVCRLDYRFPDGRDICRFASALGLVHDQRLGNGDTVISHFTHSVSCASCLWEMICVKAVDSRELQPNRTLE